MTPDSLIHEIKMKKPIRIQRKRVKGWKMPPNTVYVGRPTKFGNPFLETTLGTTYAMEMYKSFLAGTMDGMSIVNAAKRELKGKNLACFCALNKPCHADVLLKIANQ